MSNFWDKDEPVQAEKPPVKQVNFWEKDELAAQEAPVQPQAQTPGVDLNRLVKNSPFGTPGPAIPPLIARPEPPAYKNQWPETSYMRSPDLDFTTPLSHGQEVIISTDGKNQQIARWNANDGTFDTDYKEVQQVQSSFNPSTGVGMGSMPYMPPVRNVTVNKVQKITPDKVVGYADATDKVETAKVALARSIIPTASGFAGFGGGAALGVALAPETGFLSLALPLLFGGAGGFGAGMAGQSLQDKAFPITKEQQLALDSNPTTAGIASFLPALAAAPTSPKTYANLLSREAGVAAGAAGKLASNSALMAGMGTGNDVGANLVAGKPAFEGVGLGSILHHAATGLVLGNANKLGRGMEYPGKFVANAALKPFGKGSFAPQQQSATAADIAAATEAEARAGTTPEATTQALPRITSAEAQAKYPNGYDGEVVWPDGRVTGWLGTVESTVNIVGGEKPPAPTADAPAPAANVEAYPVMPDRATSTQAQMDAYLKAGQEWTKKYGQTHNLDGTTRPKPLAPATAPATATTATAAPKPVDPVAPAATEKPATPAAAEKPTQNILEKEVGNLSERIRFIKGELSRRQGEAEAEAKAGRTNPESAPRIERLKRSLAEAEGELGRLKDANAPRSELPKPAVEPTADEVIAQKKRELDAITRQLDAAQRRITDEKTLALLEADHERISTEYENALAAKDTPPVELPPVAKAPEAPLVAPVARAAEPVAAPKPATAAPASKPKAEPAGVVSAREQLAKLEASGNADSPQAKARRKYIRSWEKDNGLPYSVELEAPKQPKPPKAAKPEKTATTEQPVANTPAEPVVAPAPATKPASATESARRTITKPDGTVVTEPTSEGRPKNWGRSTHAIVDPDGGVHWVSKETTKGLANEYGNREGKFVIHDLATGQKTEVGKPVKNAPVEAPKASDPVEPVRATEARPVEAAKAAEDAPANTSEKPYSIPGEGPVSKRRMLEDLIETRAWNESSNTSEGRKARNDLMNKLAKELDVNIEAEAKRLAEKKAAEKADENFDPVEEPNPRENPKDVAEREALTAKENPADNTEPTAKEVEINTAKNIIEGLEKQIAAREKAGKGDSTQAVKQRSALERAKEKLAELEGKTETSAAEAPKEQPKPVDTQEPGAAEKAADIADMRRSYESQMKRYRELVAEGKGDSTLAKNYLKSAESFKKGIAEAEAKPASDYIPKEETAPSREDYAERLKKKADNINALKARLEAGERVEAALMMEENGYRDLVKEAAKAGVEAPETPGFKKETTQDAKDAWKELLGRASKALKKKNNEAEVEALREEGYSRFHRDPFTQEGVANNELSFGFGADSFARDRGYRWDPASKKLVVDEAQLNHAKNRLKQLRDLEASDAADTSIKESEKYTTKGDNETWRLEREIEALEKQQATPPKEAPKAEPVEAPKSPSVEAAEKQVENINDKLAELERTKKGDSPEAEALRTQRDKLQATIDAQKPVSEDVRSKAEKWADDTIAEGKKRLNSGLDPELLAAYAVKGALKFGRALKDFKEFSREMLNEFGDGIKPHLKAIFDKAKEPGLAKEYAEQQLAREAGAKPEPDLKAQAAKMAEERATQREQDKKLAEGEKPELSAGGKIWRSVVDHPIVAFLKPIAMRMRTIADLNPQSETAQKVVNDFSLIPGKKETGPDFNTAAANQRNIFFNKFTLALGPVLRDMRKMSATELLKFNDIFIKAVEGRLKTEIGGETGEAVKRVREVLNEMHQYGLDAGLDMGKVTDYFPRGINADLVTANRAGFEEAAARAYERQWERLQKEGLETKNTDPVTKKVEVTTQAELGFAEETTQRPDFKEMARKWADAIELGHEGLDFERGIFDQGNPSTKENFQKKREFTKEEASEFDAFRDKDFETVLATHIGGMVRRSEVARRLGADGMGWAEAASKMNKEGVSPEHIAELKTALQSNLGVSADRLTNKAAEAYNTYNLITTSAFLKATGLLNLGEAASIGLREGDPIQAAKALFTNGARVRNVLKRLTPEQTTQVKNEIERIYGKGHDLASALAIELGINQIDHGLGSISAGYHLDAGPSDSGKARRMNDNVYRMFGIHATEVAKRESSLVHGMKFIDKSIQFLEGNSNLQKIFKVIGKDVRADTLAKDRIMELGVKEADVQGFTDFAKTLRGLDGDAQLKLIMSGDPMAAEYRKALTIFNKQSSVQATAASRLKFANDTTFGKVLFQFTTFTNEWSAQHGRYMVETAKKIKNSDGRYTGTERLLAAGAAPAYAVAVAGMWAVRAIANQLTGFTFNNKGAPSWVKSLADAVVYTGILGPAEMLYKAVFRQQVPGGVFGDWIKNALQVYGRLKENPDSDAAQRSATKVGYRSGFVPAAIGALSLAPPNPVTAVASQVIANNRVENAVADWVSGKQDTQGTAKAPSARPPSPPQPPKPPQR